MHGPSVRGRLRTDPALLVLIGLVVALTTLLVSAVGPLSARTSDRAVASAVRDAGVSGVVVASLPGAEERGLDPDARVRDPQTVELLRLDASYAQSRMTGSLSGVVDTGVATLTTPALHLLDAGPGRYLSLAFIDTPRGAPAVRYTAGAAPRASTGRPAIRLPDDAGPWPVQVALSEAVAGALDLAPGDSLTAEDEQARPVQVRVSGVFTVTDPTASAWQIEPRLLQPVQGRSDGVGRTSATALVSGAAAPDLVLAVPSDDVTSRVVFTPQPSRVRFDQTAALRRSLATLKASAAVGSGAVSWDSLLDGVLADAGDRVAAARGQAEVLLLGLLAAAALVLMLAAQLLVLRRAQTIGVARERGASLPGIGAELLVEAVAVAVTGVGAGLLMTWALVGDVGWLAALPVLVVATTATPTAGMLLAARSTDARKVPANRTARRAATRVRNARRLLVEGAVVAAAALSFVALHQRGVLDGGVATSGAPTWWTVAGTLLVLRAVPPLARLALRRARRSTGGVALFVTARAAQTAGRALPLLVVTVTVAQLVLGVVLATTEREGQAAGALLDVGGDARLVTTPGADVGDLADQVAARPGVIAMVAGRVVDGTRIFSSRGTAAVRFVVVDAPAYEHLLASSSLPDAPALKLLAAGDDDRVPALLLGGGDDLRDGLRVRWDDDTDVALRVVGVAPRVGASADPVVVVDATALTAAGVEADPDTVWAVGPGAAAAMETLAGRGEVTLASTVLEQRRDAPLAAGLVHLAVAAAVLLLLLAGIGVVLGAASDAPARAQSSGRLRSLGVDHASLRRVVAGELLAPVVVGAAAGLVLGLGAALATFDALSLERVTGQSSPPGLVVPWWIVSAVAALVVLTVVIARAESRRLRRTSLARLLRGG